MPTDDMSDVYTAVIVSHLFVSSHRIAFTLIKKCSNFLFPTWTWNRSNFSDRKRVDEPGQSGHFACSKWSDRSERIKIITKLCRNSGRKICRWHSVLYAFQRNFEQCGHSTVRNHISAAIFFFSKKDSVPVHCARTINEKTLTIRNKKKTVFSTWFQDCVRWCIDGVAIDACFWKISKLDNWIFNFRFLFSVHLFPVEHCSLTFPTDNIHAQHMPNFCYCSERLPSSDGIRQFFFFSSSGFRTLTHVHFAESSASGLTGVVRTIHSFSFSVLGACDRIRFDEFSSNSEMLNYAHRTMHTSLNTFAEWTEWLHGAWASCS